MVFSACMTCGQPGHSTRTCENECLFCNKRHDGAIRPLFPRLHKSSDHDSQACGLANIHERIAQGEHTLKKLNDDVFAAHLLRRQIERIENDVVQEAGGPRPVPVERKAAALLTMGREATWRDIEAGWREMLGPQQQAPKAQWNAEAMGEQAYAEDSKLKAQLVLRGRLTFQRDAEGFPIE
jgi:hypothetical protein